MLKIEETDHRFEIKPSTIPGAGLGLFATEKINKDDYLEIIGVMVDVADVTHMCTKFAENYKFAAEPKHSFCHAVIPMGYAALVNHADAPEKQNVAIAHLSTERKPRNPNAGQVVYMALRDIEKNEELFANYNRKSSNANELFAWKQLVASNIYGLKTILAEKQKIINASSNQIKQNEYSSR